MASSGSNSNSNSSSLLGVLVLLPNRVLCAAGGAFWGAFLGSLGLPIDGESHFFFRGAYRGALNFGAWGWHLPEAVLSNCRNRLGDFIERVFSRSRWMLEYPNRTQLVFRTTPSNLLSKLAEVERLRATGEYHQKKAEEELRLAIAYRTQAAELESYLAMEQYLTTKEQWLASKKKSEIDEIHSFPKYKHIINKKSEEEIGNGSKKPVLDIPSSSAPSSSLPSSSRSTGTLQKKKPNTVIRELKTKSKRIVDAECESGCDAFLDSNRNGCTSDCQNSNGSTHDDSLVRIDDSPPAQMTSTSDVMDSALHKVLTPVKSSSREISQSASGDGNMNELGANAGGRDRPQHPSNTPSLCSRNLNTMPSFARCSANELKDDLTLLLSENQFWKARMILGKMGNSV